MDKFSRKNIEKVLETYFTDDLISTIFEDLEYLQAEEEAQAAAMQQPRRIKVTPVHGTIYDRACSIDGVLAWLEEVGG